MARQAAEALLSCHQTSLFFPINKDKKKGWNLQSLVIKALGPHIRENGHDG